MGNQHLSGKYAYDGKSKYILPNKVQNPYGFSSHSNEKDSKMRKSFNQEKSLCFNKSNINRNLFGDCEGQLSKKLSKKHQRSHSYTIIGLNTNQSDKNKENADSSGVKRLKFTNTQLENCQHRVSIQKIDMEKIFGKCNIDTRRAIADSSVSYIAALDSRVQNFRENGYEKQRLKDDDFSIQTRRHVVSHCDLLKPKNQEIFKTKKGIEQTRKRDYSVCEQPIEALEYQIYRQECVKQVKGFGQIIDDVQLNQKMKEGSNRSRTKTQNTINFVQNSRLKIQHLEEQLSMLKRQIQMQNQEIKHTNRKINRPEVKKSPLKKVKYDEQESCIADSQRSYVKQVKEKIRLIKNGETPKNTYQQQFQVKLQQKITTRKIEIKAQAQEYLKDQRHQLLSNSEGQDQNQNVIRQLSKRMQKISDRIQPPFQQFLSTQPICQQILQEDHLSIIKQIENDDDQNEDNTSSVVRSFKHNKSQAYFGFHLEDQEEAKMQNQKQNRNQNQKQKQAEKTFKQQRCSQIKDKRSQNEQNSRFSKYSDRLKRPLTKLNNLNYIRAGRRETEQTQSQIRSVINH